jgi:hypothetical protein
MSASYYNSRCDGNPQPNNGNTHVVNGGSIPWIENHYNHQGGNTYGNMYNCNAEPQAFAPGAAYGVDGGCCNKMMHNDMPLYKNGVVPSNMNAGNSVESFCGNVVDPQQFYNGMGPGNGMVPTMDHERLTHSFQSHGNGNDFANVYQNHSERYYVAPPPAPVNAVGNANLNANLNAANLNAANLNAATLNATSGGFRFSNVANMVDSGSSGLVRKAKINNNLLLAVAALVAAMGYYGKLGKNNRNGFLVAIIAIVVLVFLRFE